MTRPCRRATVQLQGAEGPCRGHGRSGRAQTRAILAADVVGYSRLMEADEGGTHARLKSVREALIDPAVARHQGRIVKLTGDGALVEFSSVVQAVQCAIAIQRGRVT